MHLGRKICGVAGWLLVLVLMVDAGATAQEASGVAVVRTSASWAPGDAAQDGAAEMLVLLEIARVRAESTQAGLVAVGDRRGIFPAGAEEALHEAVKQGIPVVKLARGGRVLPAPHGLFLDGGSLSEEDAARTLDRCLKLHGALPASAENGKANRQLRDQLRRFQNEFTLAASTRLAVR